ncbi:hypothetical protein HMPREF1624_07018 [Sporothrix schenckii ATCC 58251]|uniref:Uncharacterized protein n=1 Tax=Sporothrix schenckii (strain ATCC 58251 / de Perez 2211183) TaxID=1391915 RepID=U7PPY8_SPOS1|nr:hypothetical protein HMPREF1624_07018 [Sporothrix schenckii ATCC 58251]
MAPRLTKVINRRSSPPSSSSSPPPALPQPSQSQPRQSRKAPEVSSNMAVSIDTSAAHMSAPITEGPARMLTPPPSSARADLAMRIGDFALNSPIAERGAGGGSASPASEKVMSTGSAFFAQNRAILLSGLPQSPMSKESPPPPPQSQSPSPGLTQGRSLPPPTSRRNLTPLVTVNTPEGSQHHRHQQHHYAPLSAVAASSPYSPLQSPRTLSPCVNVKATHLRHPRRSCVSSSNGASSAKNEGGGASEAGLTPPPEGRLLVSAYIVPANKNRASFQLRREFNLQELLDAVPRPPTDRRRPSSVNILASPIVGTPGSPLSALSSSANAGPPAQPPSTPVTAGGGNSIKYKTGMKRPASDLSPNTPDSPPPKLRQQAAGRHSRQPSQKELAPPDQFQADGSVLIPIRPHPSLGGLPGLAAIILSCRVNAGDVVELPLPHPEFWPQTASYVYRNRGDLTDEVRQNIEYLGGKCD